MAVIVQQPGSSLLRDSPLDSLVAVVTGGVGDIGRAIVSRLRAQGATVTTIDVASPPEHDDAAASHHFRCDVTEPGQVSEAFRRIEARFGPVGLFVASAGVDSPKPFVELEPAEWHRVVDASLTGTFLTLQAAVRSMRRGGGGRAVALSSGWATKGYAGGSHYAAAKAGVEALVKSVALEEAGNGIRVNVVAPGPVRTQMTAAIPDYEAWEARRVAAIPLGRIGDPDDVAATALFLLGPESSHVTGQVWHVNGGMLMP